MLIERQVAPAFILVGGALVLPEALAAWKDLPLRPPTTALIVGNLFAGAGLFLSFLLLLEPDQRRIWRVLVLSLFGVITLLFVAGTALVAWRIGGTGAVLPLAAACLPLLGTGLAAWFVRRDTKRD